MDAQDAIKQRKSHAAEVLRRLDEIGAIKLEVLVAKAAEIQGISGARLDDDDHGICYPFYIRIGPRADLDLVSVAAQVQQLGFDLKRIGGPVK
jgi:hypothetical protein